MELLGGPQRPPPARTALLTLLDVEEEGHGSSGHRQAQVLPFVGGRSQEDEDSRRLLLSTGPSSSEGWDRSYAPLWQDVPRANYNRGNARMGAWALLSLAGWGWTRVVCVTMKLPDDCVRHGSVLDTLNDVQTMMLFSFVQGWFTEVTQPRRYQWVFSRWYFWLLFFLSGTLFSAISSIPALESSLSLGSHYSGVQIAVYVLLGLLLVVLVAFHFHHAWHIYPTRNFLTYVGARLAVLVFYLTYGLVGLSSHSQSGSSGGGSLHLHHYLLSWSLSLLAQFQHPVSVALLAITAGIFVQGIGAYHAASLFDTPHRPCWYPDDFPQ